MPKIIKDEFSDLPVSRQRRWQLRKTKLGCCNVCGRPAVFSSRCLDHAIQNREQQRKKLGRQTRLNSKSYRLEAAAKADNKAQQRKRGGALHACSNPARSVSYHRPQPQPTAPCPP